MRAFSYERASSPAEAAARAAEVPGAKFIAGGTNLLDLMKHEIENPAAPDRCARHRLKRHYRYGRGWPAGGGDGQQ
ncbi:FAD binding domain-containing protein [Vreelandella lionensis]|uniref:FAD binding domain-containing protein n=1 Tax=Vreelandella lionensis TaxID=1144478 RepID=UPI0024366EC9|nr:FAD binding domain-containing protein [Halomonas lionensis]